MCQSGNTIDLERIINGKGILLADLSQGVWGEESSSLMGSILFSQVWDVVRRRAAIPEEQRRDFVLYIDEFQSFVSGSISTFSDVLAKARSLRLSLVLAHQNLSQLPTGMTDVIDANCRSKIAYQLARQDSAYFSKVFYPLDAEALQSLPKFEIAARFSIGGEVSDTFTARTLPKPEITDPGIMQDAINASRAKYSSPVEEVDEHLRKLFEPPDEGLPGRKEKP